MSDHGDEPNAEIPSDDQGMNGDPGKRSRTLSRKGLQYAVEEKCRQTITIHKHLRAVIRSAKEADNDHITESVLSNLVTTAGQLKAALQELQSLYEQDKYNDVECKPPLAQEQLELNHAYVLIDEIKINLSNKRVGITLS